MALHNIILFIFFLAVAIVAVIMVYANRKKTQNRHSRVQEPQFGENSRKNPYFDDANLQQLSTEGENFVDPVVESNNYPIQKTEYLNKYDVNSKITSYKIVTAEKNKELLQTELTQTDNETSDEGDEDTRLHSEKFFPNDLISIMLIAAADKPFVGYELLQALLSAGLRFGKMNIFHRFDQLNVEGGIMFSLASAVKPGIFEIAKMGGFSSPALVLFMRVSVQKEPQIAFDTMLTTARQLVEDLGGEVKDAQREILNEEKIAEIRKKIAEYEKTKTTSELFA